MNTSLTINMKSPAGKNIGKSITYVSAGASSGDLKSMATGLVGLTTNTYESADRVQKINVDTESIPGESSKPEPTFTIGSLSYTESYNVPEGFTSGYYAPITYNGDGTLCASRPYFENEDESWTMPDMVTQFCPINGTTNLFIYAREHLDSFDGILYATEGASYAAKSITYSYESEEG